MAEAVEVIVYGDGGREEAVRQMSERFGHSCKIINTSVSFEELAEIAQNCEAELVYIGPENPLVNGVVDFLRDKSIPAFGPTAKDAVIEGSKIHFRELIEKAVPGLVAPGAHFTNMDKAIDYIQDTGYTVVKYDGLAGGKGVFPELTLDNATKRVEDLFINGKYKGEPVIVEKNLDPDGGSEEYSLIFKRDVFGNIIITPLVQDHKREGEGATGDNTGGMGTYASTQLLPNRKDEITQIAESVSAALGDYTGTVYVQLIVLPDGTIYGLEINARDGDPEKEAQEPLFASDPIPIYKKIANAGSIEGMDIKFLDGATCNIVKATQGYPRTHSQHYGHTVHGLDTPLLEQQDKYRLYQTLKFNKEKKVYENWASRPVHCVGIGKDVFQAQERGYDLAFLIWWPGCWMRRDIAGRYTNLAYSAPGVSHKIRA